MWLGWQGYDPYYPVSADMIEALLPFVQIKVITDLAVFLSEKVHQSVADVMLKWDE